MKPLILAVTLTLFLSTAAFASSNQTAEDRTPAGELIAKSTLAPPAATPSDPANDVLAAAPLCTSSADILLVMIATLIHYA